MRLPECREAKSPLRAQSAVAMLVAFDLCVMAVSGLSLEVLIVVARLMDVSGRCERATDGVFLAVVPGLEVPCGSRLDTSGSHAKGAVWCAGALGGRVGAP